MYFIYIHIIRSTYIHMYIYTYIYTYIHTYIYVYTHIYVFIRRFGHAATDRQAAYMTESEIKGESDRDPLLGTIMSLYACTFVWMYVCMLVQGHR
jgi:hypothetical protein